jgi:hypothetical protein
MAIKQSLQAILLVKKAVDNAHGLTTQRKKDRGRRNAPTVKNSTLSRSTGALRQNKVNRAIWIAQSNLG